MEYLIRQTPNDYKAKSEFLNKNGNKIQILALGSSHGLNDIDPEYFSRYAFNAANVSQSLDIDSKILKKHEDKLTSLQYILIPVSYHSLFGTMKTGIETWRQKYYNIYYDIDIERNPLKVNELFSCTMKHNIYRLRMYYIKDYPTDLHITELGTERMRVNNDTTRFIKNSEAAAKRHTSEDLNHQFEENVGYLKEIIETGNKIGAKIIFFTPPFHKVYRDLLSKEQLNKLYTLMNELKDDNKVFYYNFINSDDKLDFNDFTNGDHLSYLGARKFTLELDSIINSIDTFSIPQK